MLNERDKLYKRWKRKPNDQQRKTDYNRVRNTVNKKVAWAKNSYYRKKFESVTNDPKKTWQIINEISGKKPENGDSQICKHMKEQNAEQIVEKFGNHFLEGVEELIHICEDKLYQSEIKLDTCNSMFLETADNEEVCAIMINIS